MKQLIAFLILCNFAFAGDFTRKNMAGWETILSQEATDSPAAQQRLESALSDLNDIFPKKALNVLHRIPIQANWNGSGTGTGSYDSKTHRVILTSSREYDNKILLVHELSHAAHNLGGPGFGNGRIEKAYQEVVRQELYPRSAYLMTNYKEYFAEMSVVYLYRLHYYPHDRETLKEHDPLSYKLMLDFWGNVEK